MNCEEGRIYLPCSKNHDVDSTLYLKGYMTREFPEPADPNDISVYSVPRIFKTSGQIQGNLAEHQVFKCLQNLKKGDEFLSPRIPLWVTFFHGACYGGTSNRNKRDGKLIIREHDFVVFARHGDKHYMALLEVKSTRDQSASKTSSAEGLEKTSDAKMVKNNKRSAQHQLRDHLEVLEGVLGVKPQDIGVQKYVMWPFLGSLTRDPCHNLVKRWKEDGDLHVYEDVLGDQNRFDRWFFDTVIEESKHAMEENVFDELLKRYILLSCGVFVDEIHEGMLALLTQEQLHLINAETCHAHRPLVVHGAAGTGKTLLVLRKLEQLYRSGELNDQNRALYICYWPGIRCDFEQKLQKLGIGQHVDTERFYITLPEFLRTNHRTYRHVFMDECEALCLSFDAQIVRNTLGSIYRHYHAGNCSEGPTCPHLVMPMEEDISDKLQGHPTTNKWGELWFLVDINQASIFLPKNSPSILKRPCIELSKVMRCTAHIFHAFKQFYAQPMPLLPKKIMDTMHIPDISLGHHVEGPPIYWVDSRNRIDKATASIVADLCSTKGFKPGDLCVLPFFVNDRLVPIRVNRYIDEFFAGDYRPVAINDVERFLKEPEPNHFLLPWVLRVKGLEFKVVVMAIDDDDFDCNDGEDRKRAYIMASRCTCLLIVVCNQSIKGDICFSSQVRDYPFGLSFLNDI